jgi:hypothetical protein
MDEESRPDIPQHKKNSMFPPRLRTPLPPLTLPHASTTRPFLAGTLAGLHLVAFIISTRHDINHHVCIFIFIHITHLSPLQDRRIRVTAVHAIDARRALDRDRNAARHGRVAADSGPRGYSSGIWGLELRCSEVTCHLVLERLCGVVLVLGHGEGDEFRGLLGRGRVGAVT